MSRIVSLSIWSLFLVAFLGAGPGCASSPSSDSQPGSLYESFWEEHKSKVDGYRLPEGGDLSYWGTNEETYFYKSTDNEGKAKAPYWTKGNFNADQIIDYAYLLFSERDDSAAAFVFLSESNSDYRLIKIASANKHMGISTETVKISSQARDLIKLFEFEGHGALYIWDSESGNFQKWR